jgi:hypothetical protein
MYVYNYEERKAITVGTHKKSITLKECAATAITSLEETRNLGIALMINSMQVECARIAI